MQMKRFPCEQRQEKKDELASDQEPQKYFEASALTMFSSWDNGLAPRRKVAQKWWKEKKNYKWDEISEETVYFSFLKQQNCNGVSPVITNVVPEDDLA